MNYEQMIRETDDIVRRVMWHNDMVTWLLGGMLAGLMIVLGWIAWSEHRERMRMIREQRERQEWDDVRETFGQKTYYRM